MVINIWCLFLQETLPFMKFTWTMKEAAPPQERRCFLQKETLLEVEDHAICLQKAKYLVESLMMVSDGGDGYILFTFLGPQFLVLKNQRRHSPLEQAPNTCFTTLFLRYL